MSMQPSFGAPATPAAPKSKIVGKFQTTMGKTFGSMPSSASLGTSLGVNGATADRPEVQQAAPTGDTGGFGAAPTINDQQEAITTPNTPVDNDPSDGGISAIGRIGKAATAEETIKAGNRARIAQEQAAALGKANPSLGSFDGSGEGSGLDGEQLMYAKQIANIGKQRGASDEDIQIAIATALAESGLRNLNHGDRDSVGLFQQRTSQGWGSVDQIMDPTYSAGKFFDTLKTSSRGATPWQTAQNVQRSAFADGSNYQAQWGLAQQAFKSIYSGGQGQDGVSVSPTMGANGSAQWINANNNKYHDFDGAYGAQCVDLYNFYMTGFVGGKSSVGMVNYAQELWGNHDRGALVQVAKNQTPQMGDIAIWSNSMNGAGGHVAIVAQSNGNGTIRVLNANVATNGGSKGTSIMSNLSTGSLLGYLRPRKLM